MKNLDSDILDETLFEIGQEFPWIIESLINERDLYMAAILRDIMARGDGGDVVAVVGAAHVKGIMKLLQDEENAPGTVITPQRVETVSLLPSNAGEDGTIRVADLQQYARERGDIVRAALLRAAETRKQNKG